MNNINNVKGYYVGRKDLPFSITLIYFSSVFGVILFLKVFFLHTYQFKHNQRVILSGNLLVQNTSTNIVKSWFIHLFHYQLKTSLLDLSLILLDGFTLWVRERSIDDSWFGDLYTNLDEMFWLIWLHVNYFPPWQEIDINCAGIVTLNMNIISWQNPSIYVKV